MRKSGEHRIDAKGRMSVMGIGVRRERNDEEMIDKEIEIVTEREINIVTGNGVGENKKNKKKQESQEQSNERNINEKDRLHWIIMYLIIISNSTELLVRLILTRCASEEQNRIN